MSSHEWAKLHVDWYADEVLRVAAKLNRDALIVWPVMVAMAKRNSSPDNKDGVFASSVDSLAEIALTSSDSIRQVLELLVEGELIEVADGRLGTLKIRLTRFAYWQTARGTEANKKEKQRNPASREKAVECPASVPVVSRSRPLEEKREEEKREEETISSTSAEGSRPKGPDHARALFEHWIAITERSAAQNRLTRQRRSKVNARLRDGYTVEQLRTAIDGIASSPWHTGDNPSSKRYDTFDFIFRSGENVEKGIDYAVANANREAARSVPGGVDLDATRRSYRELGLPEHRIDELIDKLRKGTAA